MNPSELKREEDCDEEPITREDMPITIVEEEYSCQVYAATTTKSDYGMVGDKIKQELLDPDILKLFDRAMVSAHKRRSLHPSHEVHHPYTGTIGPAWSPGTFQPPALCQDWVLRVASLIRSFRNNGQRQKATKSGKSSEQ